MDYIKLLNLNSEPFSNSPDPSFFYCSRTYQICLQNLEISIRLKRGLNIVLGDIGTGKTTLSRALIQQFKSEEDRFLFQLILDPSFKSESEFLYVLLTGFGIKPPAENTPYACMEAIRQFLLHEGLERDRVIVLIVDEGQKLSPSCLELLRDLLNFETNECKLLQLIIMAQNELNAKIKGKRNLTDRINTFHTLRPLNLKETQEVIEFRLIRAGWNRERTLFSEEAIDRIYHYSKGYPRKIITLCHHALIYMLIRNAPVVEPDIVDQAISQIYEYSKERTDQSNMERGKSHWFRPRSGISLRRMAARVTPIFLIIMLILTLMWAARNMKQVNFAFQGERTKGATAMDAAVSNREINPGETHAPSSPASGLSLNVSDQYPVNFTHNENQHRESSLDIEQFSLDEEETMPGHVLRSAPTPERHPEEREINRDASKILKKIEVKPIQDTNREIIAELKPIQDTRRVIIAREGDTVIKLARQIYDFTITDNTLRRIWAANPHIGDLDHIEVGYRIYFPELSNSGKE